MTTYITADNKLHDDAEGNAIHLSSWPKNARIATQAEIDAIQNPPKTTEQQNNDIKARIVLLEANSLRTLREAILTGDKSALIITEADIVKERAKLK